MDLSQSLFAQAVADAKTSPSNLPRGLTSASLVWGVVSSIQYGSPPSLTCTIAGSSVPVAGIKFMSRYDPVVGNVVMLTQIGNDLVVMDTLAGSANNGGRFLGYNYGPPGFSKSGYTYTWTGAGPTPEQGDWSFDLDGSTWLYNIANGRGWIKIGTGGWTCTAVQSFGFTVASGTTSNIPCTTDQDPSGLITGSGNYGFQVNFPVFSGGPTVLGSSYQAWQIEYNFLYNNASASVVGLVRDASGSSYIQKLWNPYNANYFDMTISGIRYFNSGNGHLQPCFSSQGGNTVSLNGDTRYTNFSMSYIGCS